MFAKNRINRNKTDNKDKSDKKILILCHLYKIISMDISSWSNLARIGCEATPTKRTEATLCVALSEL